MDVFGGGGGQVHLYCSTFVSAADAARLCCMLYHGYDIIFWTGTSLVSGCPRIKFYINRLSNRLNRANILRRGRWEWRGGLKYEAYYWLYRVGRWI